MGDASLNGPARGLRAFLLASVVLLERVCAGRWLRMFRGWQARNPVKVQSQQDGSDRGQDGRREYRGLGSEETVSETPVGGMGGCFGDGGVDWRCRLSALPTLEGVAVPTASASTHEAEATILGRCCCLWALDATWRRSAIWKIRGSPTSFPVTQNKSEVVMLVGVLSKDRPNVTGVCQEN